MSWALVSFREGWEAKDALEGVRKVINKQVCLTKQNRCSQLRCAPRMVLYGECCGWVARQYPGVVAKPIDAVLASTSEGSMGEVRKTLSWPRSWANFNL